MKQEEKNTIATTGNARSGTGKKTLRGTVVSAKMRGTVVVAVDRYVKHPVYGKYRRITKRYQADAPDGAVPVGERVLIESCRPISKHKHFRLVRTAGSAG